MKNKIKSFVSTGMSGNQLKIIAAISMLIDHIGVYLIPELQILRIIGRLSFPIFAYFIYEGCRYTGNRGKYLYRLFTLGIVCSLGYYLYSGEVYFNILITFSFSVLILNCLDYFKRNASKMTYLVPAMLSIGFAAVFSGIFLVDYGFWGVMLPVFTAVFEYLTDSDNSYLKAKQFIFSIIGFTMGLLIICIQSGRIQTFCLLSLPLIMLYNGKRGKRRMNSFFYWFYPVHLVVLGVMGAILELIK